MVCDDVNQDKHIIGACIWISFNKKSVYMHVLLLHKTATEQPNLKMIVIPNRTIITCRHSNKFSLFHALFSAIEAEKCTACTHYAES